MSGRLHARVERALGTIDCDVGASECHGMLCGMLCGPWPFEPMTWYSHLSASDDVGAFATGEPRLTLDELADQTCGALAGGEFDFALLLPGDDEALALRAAAFAAWCRGYLSGLGLSGIADLSMLGEDARGFLDDIVRFGTLDVGPEAGEDEERALAELNEFTRMGVLIVHAETRGRGDEFEAPPGIH